MFKKKMALTLVKMVKKSLPRTIAIGVRTVAMEKEIGLDSRYGRQLGIYSQGAEQGRQWMENY